MSNAIKPIETQYAGCRFRSRLEARWAVFFDTAAKDMGVQRERFWLYEPEGYEINGRWYLPDFYLPYANVFVEVKADQARLDRSLIEEAALMLATPFLLLGPIPEGQPQGEQREDWAWAMYAPSCGNDACCCGGWIGVTLSGLFYDCTGAWRYNHYDFGEDPFLTPVRVPGGYIPGPYNTARSARFEHGEKG